MLAAEEDALRVHVLDPLPRLHARVEHRAVVAGRDAGVVVENVDAAEALGGRAVHRGDVLLRGDVAAERDYVALGVVGGLLDESLVDVRRAHQGPLAGEEQRGLAAHAAPRAGDHADLSVEPSHHASVEMNTFLTSE